MHHSLEIQYQPTVERLLKRTLETEKIPSAYLFAGSEGTGKWDSAVRFAAEILASTNAEEPDMAIARNKTRKLIHPDLHLLFPMPSPRNKTEETELPEHFRRSKAEDPFSPVEYGRAANILVDNVRALKRSLYSTSAEGGWKVAIFNQVERMPETSFDILLKTIEEPPSMTLLILLTDNIRRLPKTVLSRCQRVRFRPMPDDFVAQYLTGRHKIPAEQAGGFARLSNGSITEAYKLAHSDFSDRRKGALRILIAIAECDKPEIAEAVENGFDSFNRDEALAVIRIWQSMTRDMAVINDNLDDSLIINIDSATDLRKIAPKFGGMKTLTRALSELLETQKLFYRNVPARLALTRCAWRMKGILENKQIFADSGIS